MNLTRANWIKRMDAPELDEALRGRDYRLACVLLNETAAQKWWRLHKANIVYGAGITAIFAGACWELLH